MMTFLFGALFGALGATFAWGCAFVVRDGQRRAQ